MATLHQGAKAGFENAKAYDAHRPSYPPEAVEKLLGHLGIIDEAHANIVDIAAGTGKFTELLANRHENYNVIAVEPHELMREELVAKNLKGVKVVDGLAAHMPIDDEWGDAGVAAQAFHWFSDEASLKEIHRVLSPTSVLGMIWNVEDYNKPRDWPSATIWGQKLNDVLWSLPGDGQSRFKEGVWRNVFERQLKGNPLVLSDTMPLFSLPLGEDRVDWTVWLTEDALWSRFATLSHVAVLEGQARDEVYEKFRKILAGGDVERNENAEIAVHGTTYFAWTSRL